VEAVQHVPSDPSRLIASCRHVQINCESSARFHTPTVWCGGVAAATGRCIGLPLAARNCLRRKRSEGKFQRESRHPDPRSTQGATCGVPSSPHQQDGVADPGIAHCTRGRGRGTGRLDRQPPGWRLPSPHGWVHGVSRRPLPLPRPSLQREIT
jgi:hypothetical protein